MIPKLKRLKGVVYISGVGERKVRSDKKKEIKPVLSIRTKDLIYRLSYITHTPVKDVCEWLCIHVINDRNNISHLSRYFVRDVWVGNTLYCGDITNKGFKKRVLGLSGRVTTRFKQPTYEVIAILSYALDCTPTRTVAILLDIAVKDIVTVNEYVKRFLNDNLTKNQMRELRAVLTEVNRNNHVNSSWATLLSHIVDNSNVPVTRIRDAIGDFLNRINKP